MIQKSIREGFGLTVSEALWKARPDGRRARRRHRHADRGRRDRLARRLVRGRARPRASRSSPTRRAARARALVGKEHVRRHFLTPRLLRDWLALFNRLLGRETRRRARGRSPRERPAALAPDTVRAVAGRRKLIVVSNRGPVSYARVAGRRADHAARRRRARHRAAQPRRAPRRDVDRERDERRGSRGRGRARRARRSTRRARDGSPYRLRLVAHDPAAYDWFYNVVANPTLWFLQHYMWGLAVRAGRRPRPARRVVQRLRAGERGRSRTRSLAELEREPDAAVFFHDYHLYLAPRLVRERAPGRAARRTSSTSRGRRPDYWHVLPAAAARRGARGPARERRRRLPHRAAGGATSSARCEDVLGAEVDYAASTVTHDGRRTLVTSHPIGDRPGGVRRAARRRATCSSRSGDRRARGRSSSSCASTAPTRRRTSCAASARSRSSSSSTRSCTAASRCSRCSTRRARTSRSTRSTSPRSSARRAPSTTASSATAGCRSTSQVADNFAQSVAAYKQYDVLLVNAVFDGLNLVSKEAPLVNDARRRAHPLRERRRARGARRVGADRQSVRRLRPGAGDPRGADDGAGRAARRGSTAIRAHVARARPRRLDRGAARRPRPGRALGAELATAAYDSRR